MLPSARAESAVAAKYILAALSLVFLSMAASRRTRDGAGAASQARTWMIVGVTFAVVSAWLFIRST